MVSLGIGLSQSGRRREIGELNRWFVEGVIEFIAEAFEVRRRRRGQSGEREVVEEEGEERKKSQSVADCVTVSGE